MKRSHKLWIMGGVLALAVILTVSVFFMDQKLEKIKTSGETILSIPAESVTGLSWDHDGETLSFRKDDVWHWEEDEAFPVSELDFQNMLDPFTHLTAAFRIEDVEDYSQYGFDAPVCTIGITTEDASYEIRLGAYSQMDQQRYVDLGDGNVYLLFHDPMMEFDVGIRDVIQNDDIPYIKEADRITFRGQETYRILKNPEGGKSHRPEDLYFAERNGKLSPLNTSSVADYLQDLALTGLQNYETYTASQEDLSKWGLDAPELTIQVDYTLQQEDSETEEQRTYTLSLSRDPEALKASLEAEDPDSVFVPVYGRVDQSERIYEISADDYSLVTACSYDDLRHREVFPASTQDITALEMTLDGNTYAFESAPQEEDETLLQFTYLGNEIDADPVLTALRSLHAEEFTEEIPTGQREISIQALLSSGESVHLELYRKDGTHCIAKVDGEVLSLVPRSQVVDLMEEIRSIVLAPAEETEETQPSLS